MLPTVLPDKFKSLITDILHKPTIVFKDENTFMFIYVGHHRFQDTCIYDIVMMLAFCSSAEF